MNYNELQNQKQYVRIIDSTYYKDRDSNELSRRFIGKEFPISGIDYDNNTVVVVDFSSRCKLNFSDVRFLTPVEFKGKKIAIGDEVLYGRDWCIVYGYFWFDGRLVLNIVKDNDYENECHCLTIDSITAHRSQGIDIKAEEAIKYLISKGLIVDGKILK